MLEEREIPVVFMVTQLNYLTVIWKNKCQSVDVLIQQTEGFDSYVQSINMMCQYIDTQRQYMNEMLKMEYAQKKQSIFFKNNVIILQGKSHNISWISRYLSMCCFSGTISKGCLQ